MVEADENAEEVSNNSLQCVEKSLQITKKREIHDVAEKKQRGRPKGSTDKIPRKRTVIREEPVTPVEVEPAPALIDTAPVPPAIAAIAAAEPKKKRRIIKGSAIPTSEGVTMESIRLVQNIVAERPPLSPRSLLRQAGETIYALQTQRDGARREYWAQQIAKSLR